MRLPFATSLALSSALLCLSACGIKERIEERVQEEIAEKVVELAAGDEVDVEIDSKDGKVVIVGPDGERIESDAKGGKLVFDGKDGRTVYEQGKDGNAQIQAENGYSAQIGKTIPKDFPIALPKIDELLSSIESEDGKGGKTYSVTASLDSEDPDEIATFITAQMEAEGLTVTKQEVSSDEGKMIILSAKNEDKNVDASSMITSDQVEGETVLNLMVTWNRRP